MDIAAPRVLFDFEVLVPPWGLGVLLVPAGSEEMLRQGIAGLSVAEHA